MSTPKTEEQLGLALALLRELVELRDYKERNGKDNKYRKSQLRLWGQIREFLRGIVLDKLPLQSTIEEFRNLLYHEFDVVVAELGRGESLTPERLNTLRHVLNELAKTWVKGGVGHGGIIQKTD